ncbi:MAG: hypothetical protein P4L28_11960 [Paludibacteraceae bacterium]|nr:hypothetical protein [Paludibacteraceae bacterium]
MKVKLSLLFLFLGSMLVHGQQYVTVTIDGFSDDYCVKIITKDTSATNFLKDGFVIYRKKGTGIGLIYNCKYPADDLSKYQNVKTISYDKQKYVIYEDFDFDGFKDIAVADYASKDENGIPYIICFCRKDEFVAGMESTYYTGKIFKFDNKTKTIEMWNKPDYDNAQVEILGGNFIKKIRSYNTSSNNIYTVNETTTYTDEYANLKTKTKTVKRFALNKNSQIILSFNIAKNGKKLVLYTLADSSLHYAFINKEDEVELYYPNEDTNMDYPNGECLFKSSQSDPFQVTFHNKDADYTIWDEPGKLGVEIAVKGKTYFLEGDVQSKIGLITKLKDIKTPKVCFSWQ